METIISKVRAEIERLKGIGGIVPLDNREQKTGYESALIDIESFLDTLEEKLEIPTNGSSEIPNDMEEAAEKHASMHPLCNGKPAKNSFIAGAKWQKEQDLAEMAQSKSPLSVAYANRCFENGKQAMKEQMMKEAVECYYGYVNNCTKVFLPEETPKGVKEGYAKIVILKNDE